MKKLALVLLFVAMVGALASAQIISGNTAYIPTTDVQGAHENGGRGCAGCHAPHSGGRGSGGGTVIGNVYTGVGTAEGDNGLWGTDTAPIQNTNGGQITFDGSYPVTLQGLTWSSGGLYTGVATCLSCHDGNVSKGAMMSGQSYEQAFGLLNFATNAGSNKQGAPVSLYGTAVPIPTLLGNDGGVAGDYANDHPVGMLANLGAVASAALSNGLTATVGTNAYGEPALNVVVTPSTKYAQFVSNYGYPAISSPAINPDNVATDAFVVCTTCHNQHIMNVYKGTLAATSGTFQTIFFVNGAYNPGAPYDPTHVPSTNRFCLQCHFSHSSEYYGATTVGTAF